VFEGTDTLLVEDGQFVRQTMHHEGLRDADVEQALRRQGANDVTEVQRAVLAPGGSVIVSLKPEAQTATKADIASLAAAIRRLETRLAD
jgi:uncharacterized membrane protein YcaP (DUF421 family)